MGIDFSSSLYLGFNHSSKELGRWSSLTLGKPVVMEETENSKKVSSALARLIGCEEGIFLPSTLHSFFDIFETLKSLGISTVFIDNRIYPIVRWSIERLQTKGIKIVEFLHHDFISLEKKIELYGKKLTPVVVSCGFCPGCGRGAPLKKYAEIVNYYKGFLVIR